MLRLAFLIALVACERSSTVDPDASLSCGGGCDAPFSICGGQTGGECIGDTVCTYPSDGGRPNVCSCAANMWRCDDCPSDYQQPGAICTTGDHCSDQNWEHGCTCSCNAMGHWACTGDTVGSMCPHG